jgi:hypothetical protein
VRFLCNQDSEQQMLHVREKRGKKIIKKTRQERKKEGLPTL